MNYKRILIKIAFLLSLFGTIKAKRLIYLAKDPALSPGGKTLVFSWNGDLWFVPSEGGCRTPNHEFHG